MSAASSNQEVARAGVGFFFGERPISPPCRSSHGPTGNTNNSASAQSALTRSGRQVTVTVTASDAASAATHGCLPVQVVIN